MALVLSSIVVCKEAICLCYSWHKKKKPFPILCLESVCYSVWSQSSFVESIDAQIFARYYTTTESCPSLKERVTTWWVFLPYLARVWYLGGLSFIRVRGVVWFNVISFFIYVGGCLYSNPINLNFKAQHGTVV